MGYAGVPTSQRNESVRKHSSKHSSMIGCRYLLYTHTCAHGGNSWVLRWTSVKIIPDKNFPAAWQGFEPSKGIRQKTDSTLDPCCSESLEPLLASWIHESAQVGDIPIEHANTQTRKQKIRRATLNFRVVCALALALAVIHLVVRTPLSESVPPFPRHGVWGYSRVIHIIPLNRRPDRSICWCQKTAQKDPPSLRLRPTKTRRRRVYQDFNHGVHPGVASPVHGCLEGSHGSS